MPENASLGPATVIVQPPQGPALSQKVMIAGTAPGLYPDSGRSVPKGFVYDANWNVFPLLSCTQTGCDIVQLPLSSTPGGLDFVL